MPNPLAAYFTAAYPFQDEHLRQSFQDFLETELSKGPYFQEQLPFTSRGREATNTKKVHLLAN